MNDSITVHSNIDTMNQALITRWASIAEQAISTRGSFHVALAGGNTPKQLYQQLARNEVGQALPWSLTHIYFGDERCVPPDHNDSNYCMVRQSLLDHVPIPAHQIHRIGADDPDHDRAADDYQSVLMQQLPHDPAGYHFDLVLLGLGSDGHIASLFPDTRILTVRDRLIAAVYVEKLSGWRISITFPVIEQAHHVILIVAGARKADIVGNILIPNARPDVYPVQQICQRCEWHLDTDATALVQAPM